MRTPADRDGSSRRDLLTVLGLGGAAAVAMSTDAVGEVFEGGPACPALAQGSKEAQESIASQLEALAAAVRAGTVTVCGMETKSKMNMRDPHWMDHEVVLLVEINQGKIA